MLCFFSDTTSTDHFARTYFWCVCTHAPYLWSVHLPNWHFFICLPLSVCVLPISQTLNCRPICKVDNFQRFQRQLNIFNNPRWRGVPIFDSHILLSPLAISFGVEKLKRIFISSSLVSSPSSTKWLKMQWKRKLWKMYPLRILFKGIHPGILPTGQGAQNKVYRPAIHSWAETNDGSSFYFSSMLSSPSVSLTLNHYGR